MKDRRGTVYNRSAHKSTALQKNAYADELSKLYLDQLVDYIFLSYYIRKDALETNKKSEKERLEQEILDFRTQYIYIFDRLVNTLVKGSGVKIPKDKLIEHIYERKPKIISYAAKVMPWD